MAVEIERKFLVAGDRWRAGGRGVAIRQGYLCGEEGAAAVRVRIVGEEAFLTVKGQKTGLVRAEFEYPIPIADAAEMLDALCRRPLIEKTRYTLDYGGRAWTIDDFVGENAGLVLAEVELAHSDEEVALPPWVGREVSDDPRFLNVNLAVRPFASWPPAERAEILR